jgi:hypothetical protein
MTKGRITKSGNAALLGAVVILSAGVAFANIIDPSAGVAGGGRSTEIFSTNFSFDLTPCTGPATPSECAAFTNPQAVFAGENDSGVPWAHLTLTLDFLALGSAQSFSCFGGTFFTLNNCPQTIPKGATSVTFTFFKGSGTGIGCWDALTGLGSDPANPADDSADLNCLINNASAFETGGFFDDTKDKICADDAKEVCGPSHFVIGVGFNVGPNPDHWPDGSIPTNGTGIASEPGFLSLCLAGLGAAMVRYRHLRGRKSLP